ncbi:MAG TPA: allantoate amidohydrolase [Actinomycetes bacterium]|nr:allantoate amidohydrolase [Actinomycetes bacterium]
MTSVLESAFDRLWEPLLPIGRNAATSGYRRMAYSVADLGCREWFVAAAEERGLAVETDRNGNMWAWWTGPWGGPSGNDAFVIGSHLDSVREGGAYDGPLGVVSSLAAVEVLQSQGVVPRRPFAVAAFSDEEGARFGVACAGSRLAAGTLAPDAARALRDDDGTSMAEAMTSAGLDPGDVGPDVDRLRRIGAFVELHVEQGRALVDDGAPVGLASAIWPHGRYRLTFRGEANHAGTTAMADRRDPVQAWSRTALAADAAAREQHGRATFGRLEIDPNATNAIPSEVRAWLDARAGDEGTLAVLLEQIREAAFRSAQSSGTSVDLVVESESPAVQFDATLRGAVASALREPEGHDVPVLPTGAGHDAGILAGAGVPTAMLFVRNPTGVSHSPAEFAEQSDCLAGVQALVTVVQSLAC